MKGFTEALVVDLRLHAPHIKASVVMPGHIGTSIAFNSGIAHGRDPKNLAPEHVAEMRERLARRGIDVGSASDEDLRNLAVLQAQMFMDNAPLTADQAATIILDGVRAGQWRILVGDDAHLLDSLVRANPTEAYEPAFMDQVRGAGAFATVRRATDPD